MLIYYNITQICQKPVNPAESTYLNVFRSSILHLYTMIPSRRIVLYNFICERDVSVLFCVHPSTKAGLEVVMKWSGGYALSMKPIPPLQI